jgi:hypothetical protein
MNGIYKVALVALIGICMLGCANSQKSLKQTKQLPQQGSSQTVGVKKMAAWLTGGSRVLYENDSHAIYGLEYDTLTKPTGRVVLDIFGLKNKQSKAKLHPKYFLFSIQVKDLGGEKMAFSSFSFLRNGKDKVDVKQTHCDFVYNGYVASCEVAIKLDDNEVIDEDALAVYTLVGNAKGVDTDGDLIAVEMKKYYFEPENKDAEKMLALYARSR